MEDFKRPDHPDFMDASELRHINFSGVRINSLSHYIEVWMDGIKRLEQPVAEYERNPEQFAKEYAELFGLHQVEISTTKGN